MFTDEEVQALLDAGKYQEAYDELNILYQKTRKPEYKFTMVMIDMHEIGSKNLKEYLPDVIALLKLPKRFRVPVYLQLISLQLDLEDYYGILKYGKKAIQSGIQEPLIYIAYAKALIEVKNDANQALEYLNFMMPSNNPIQQEFFYSTKLLALKILKRFEEAKKLIDELYLTIQNRSFLITEEFSLSNFMDVTYEEMKKKFDDAIQNVDDKLAILSTMFNYLKRNELFSEFLEFVEIVKPFENEINEYAIFDFRQFEAISYYQNNDYEKGIEILKSVSHIDPEAAFYLIAQGYYYSQIEKRFEKAIEFYQKTYDANQAVFCLNLIASCYYEMGEFDKAFEVALRSKKESKSQKNYDYLDMLAKLYALKGKFSKGLYYVNQAMLKKVVSYYDFVLFKKNYDINPNFFRKKYLSILNESQDEAFNVRCLASVYFHGLYGEEINRKKAKELALKAYEMNPDNSCIKSMLGNVMLKENPEYAYQLFTEGTDALFSYKESCTCCVGFKAYCLSYGIGTKMDKEAAFELIKKTIEIAHANTSENLDNIYGMLALELNRDVEEVFERIQGNLECRYQINKSFMLIKLAERLNKNTKIYQKRYKKALRFASKAEKEYYQNNPECVYLNNF